MTTTDVLKVVDVLCKERICFKISYCKNVLAVKKTVQIKSPVALRDILQSICDMDFTGNKIPIYFGMKSPISENKK